MYENETYNDILNRLLDNVSSDVDKREGSIIYDALAPAAVEIKTMYMALDTILNETFADTSSREYLIRRGAERGLSPEVATAAIMKGEFNIDVPIGSRFSLSDTSFNYEVTEKISTGVYKLESETLGAEVNNEFGTLIPIQYISGLESAEITETLILGDDEEDTEAFRTRYFSSFDSKAFGGNITDYKEKSNDIDGVGATKVTPVWDGGGSVKLTILDSDYGAPTTTLINTVQTEITNIAPIGHIVTVVGASEQTVNIVLNIVYDTGYDWSELESYVLATIDDYFIELGQSWENETTLVVRISQIESRVLAVSGVLDITSTTLNGVASNLTLDSDSVPVRGSVSG